MTDSRRVGDWVLAGRIWYNTRTGQSMRAISGGALPASDTFTGTNGTQLTAYSANWTLNAGDLDIQTNAVSPDGGNYFGTVAAHWNADSFDNDQYAQITVVALSAAELWNFIGVSVRAHASAATFYTFFGGSDGTYLYKQVAGSENQIGSVAAAVSVNDVLKLTVSGTTLTPNKNGSTTGTPGAQTDSSIASGYAGLGGYSGDSGARTNTRGDSWEGGNLSTGATGTLSATLAAATAAATGTVGVKGTLSVTLAAATCAATGTVQVTGTASATLAAATLSATAQAKSTGTLSATLADATLGAAGTVVSAPATGTLDVTLEAATCAAAGTVAIAGSLTQTLADATVSASGTVAVSGTASVTLADATCAAVGTVAIAGTAAITLADATLSATGTVTTVGEATGTLAVTLEACTVSASGNVFSLDYLRPTTDTTAGNWTTNTGASTGLYDTINEASPDNDDYAQSEVSPTASPVVFALGVGGDAGLSIGHTMRYRYGKVITGSGETVNLTVQLRQGYTNESDQGTLIAEWTHSNITEALVTAEQRLTTAQADSITNYGTLFARLVAEAV